MGRNMKVYAALCLLAILALGACTKPGDSASSSDLITISGALDGNSSSSVAMEASRLKAQSNSALDVTQYVFYCMTFSDSPSAAQSSIQADGSFSVQLPAGQPFGCFIKDASQGTVVATLVAKDSSSNFGSQSTSTISLSQSVNLGSLQLDLVKGEVSVPKSTLSPYETPHDDNNAVDLNAMDGKTYTLECVPTGDSVIDAACQEQVTNNQAQDSVYFRLLKATQNGQPIFGLGVWASQQSFANCGGIDMTDAEKSQVQSDANLQFLSGGVITGAAWSNDLNACPTRSGNAATSMNDPQNYYAVGPLVPTGPGYTLHVERDESYNSNCHWHEKTTVAFVNDPNNPGSLVGRFSSVEIREEMVSGGCGNSQNKNGNFVIRLTPQ